MKTAKVLACCLLILPFVGTSPPVLKSGTQILQRPKAPPQHGAAFGQEWSACSSLLASGRFEPAAPCFQVLASKAVTHGDESLAARATSNAGAARFALHQYRPALDLFLKARRMTVRMDSSTTAALDVNIASLYSELGEVESAAHWIENSLPRLRGEERRRFLPKLVIEMAVLRAGEGRMPEAERLFREGIEQAAAAGDLETYALGCNRMGEAFLLAGDLVRAEPPLLEAFRVRKLHHLPLDTSYHRLGRLRLAQGDLVSASHLLDRAVELAAHTRNLMPAWDIYYSRGRVRLAQGRLNEAISDLRIAIRLGRDWRRSLPAAASIRAGAESKLDQAYSAFLEAAARLYRQSPGRELVRESFAAAEENRAESLRAAAPSHSAQPPVWWDAVAAVEHAEVAALPNRSPARRQALLRARAELDRLGATLAGNLPNEPISAHLDSRVQAQLGPEAALFSFHLGDTESWLWAVDRDGLTFVALPSRAEIGRHVAGFIRAVRNSGPDSEGAQLFATLFGSVPPHFIRRSRWLLSLDRDLFDLPLAALVEHGGNRPVYVAERHVIQVIPGVLPWLESARRNNRAGPAPLFLGIGDAIYNQADPRRAAYAAASSGPVRSYSPLSLFAAHSVTAAELALPRLAASAAELAACSRAWRAESTLLEGASATRANVMRQLSRNPAVIHFATHFVASAEGSPYLLYDAGGMHRQNGAGEMIALSLNTKGETDLLTASDLAHWTVNARLVTLSGCHSAAGAALPGTGLLGLTRAWLEAGAGAVIGSLWDTPDESGALFSALYRNLNAGPSPDPAAALHSAQCEMIRAGGWRSLPEYWGAYFVVVHE